MTDQNYQAWLASLDAVRVALRTGPVFDHTACGTAINNNYSRNARGLYVPRAGSAANVINPSAIKVGHNGGPK